MPLFKPKSKKPMYKEESPKGEMSLPIAMNVRDQAMKKKPKKMSDGGPVGHEVEAVGGPGREMAKLRQNPDPMLMSAGGSVADAIMRKRKMADGGMVDLDEASEEMPNQFDELNIEAAGKEQYDDDQLESQPMDSNEHGHAEQDEQDLSMVDMIRRKMMSKRGM